MGRPCTVCSHPQRAEIEKKLASGGKNRRLASLYGLQEISLRRHRESGHITQKLLKAAAAKEIALADDLLEESRSLLIAAKEILVEARRDGERKTALLAIDRATRVIELLGRLAGELQEAPIVNVLVQPQFILVRDAVLVALEPHPEAREAVLQALVGVIEGEGRVIEGE